MANFRKRIKIAPGVHLNFSKSGVSTSIGPRGAKINVGRRGTTLHTGIPGSGIYSRRKLSNTNYSCNETDITFDKTTAQTFSFVAFLFGAIFLIIGLSKSALVCNILGGVFLSMAIIMLITYYVMDKTEEKVDLSSPSDKTIPIPEFSDQKTAAEAYDVVLKNFELINTVEERILLDKIMGGILTYWEYPIYEGWAYKDIKELYLHYYIARDNFIVRLALNRRKSKSVPEYYVQTLKMELRTDIGKENWDRVINTI